MEQARPSSHQVFSQAAIPASAKFTKIHFVALHSIAVFTLQNLPSMHGLQFSDGQTEPPLPPLLAPISFKPEMLCIFSAHEKLQARLITQMGCGLVGIHVKSLPSKQGQDWKKARLSLKTFWCGRPVLSWFGAPPLLV